MPKFPFLSIVSADMVDVANVVAEEVEIYRFPPAFLNVQWLLVSDDGSDNANCAPVDDAICSAHAGVVVPIPNPVLSPPLTYIESKALVEVENILTPDPLPDPQAVPVLDTSPLAPTCRQPVVPPPIPRYRADVEAVPVIASIEVVACVEKRLLDDAVVANNVVEVEFVVVALRPVKF